MSIWCSLLGHKYAKKHDRRFIDSSSEYKKRYITFVFNCKRKNCEKIHYKGEEYDSVKHK